MTAIVHFTGAAARAVPRGVVGGNPLQETPGGPERLRGPFPVGVAVGSPAGGPRRPGAAARAVPRGVVGGTPLQEAPGGPERQRGPSLVGWQGEAPCRWSAVPLCLGKVVQWGGASGSQPGAERTAPADGGGGRTNCEGDPEELRDEEPTEALPPGGRAGRGAAEGGPTPARSKCRRGPEGAGQPREVAGHASN